MIIHDDRPIYQQNSALYNGNVYGYNTLALPVNICNNDMAKKSGKAHVGPVGPVVPVATPLYAQLKSQ